MLECDFTFSLLQEAELILLQRLDSSASVFNIASLPFRFCSDFVLNRKEAPEATLAKFPGERLFDRESSAPLESGRE